MKLRSRVRGLLVLLALAASPCLASDYFIDVTDSGFDPKTVTINRGDTVTFRALFNDSAHNVHAQDDSFRCAVGCRGVDDGATGDPAKGTWSNKLTFNTPGVIGFQCDPHVQFGMVGSITVKDVVATPGQDIVAGLSGNWNDPTPNQGGHGVQIEVLPSNGILVLWFVFNPAGNAQAWVYTQGTYDPASNTVAIPAYLETGGTFPPHFDASKLAVAPWGTLTLTFTSCNAGTLQFAASDAAKAAGYGDVSFPIQRVTNIANLACP